MTIPAYTENGFLPTGIYPATWVAISARFGGNPERTFLLAGLHRALDVLAAAGCRRAWIDGSFVTDVESQWGRPPGDVDVCWDLAGVDIAQLAALAPELHPLRGDPLARRRRFGGDYFPVVEPIAIGQVEAFQFTRDGEPKGIIVISLLEGLR